MITLPGHLLFIEALRVHLVRQADLVLLVLVIRGIRTPPPVGIDSAAKVRIPVTPAAAVSVAIISQTVGAESQTGRVIEVSGGQAAGR